MNLQLHLMLRYNADSGVERLLLTGHAPRNIAHSSTFDFMIAHRVFF